ncbi:AAA family ATPase [uncultured Bradyrhizobium sp.]|mgnify:CR=1 FL=1|uniref:AAA family ATPase n=1 Tax=uncultured Bradyrhizobium sp. TaxID=199684 RepID=UPI0026219C87|nr:AAA family ATPase [uncultured Bradyrhizobium sp.]
MSPIHFAHTEIISIASDSSAAGLSAYISRALRDDLLSGASFNFAHKAADLVHHEVMLPDGAPELFRDPNIIWNEAAKSETTRDRKTRQIRFKRGAQVAKHTILALPKEVSDEERLELTRRFVRDNFTRFGVAVEFAIHRPDSDSENHHAHILQTTRTIGPVGFGKKARNLNPQFATKKRKRFVSEQDRISDRWAQAQNDYFRELGLDLRVDPKRSVSGIHLGPSWHAKDDAKTELAAQSDAKAAAAMTDPIAILKAVTAQKSTFTKRDLQKLVTKHGLAGDERAQAVASALAHPDIVRLHDPGNVTERFTTRDVRAQEERILEYSKRITARPLPPSVVASVANGLTLDAEQLAAFEQMAARQDGPIILIGRAGTGKSRVLAAAGIAYKAAGYSVRGLAPTNTAAINMGQDGFASTSTIHRAIYLLENGADRWDASTVCVVDEAALVDTELFEKLLKHVVSSGAKLVLAGDDRQLSSVARGGMFSALVKQFGAPELRKVRRQNVDWQREASQAFARGDTQGGLRAYSQRGFLNWDATVESSRAKLMRDWANDQNAEGVTFIYAATNAEVNSINKEAHDVRVNRGEIEQGQLFATERGPTELSPGDRLQFYANDRRARITNGIVGTVKSVAPHKIDVLTDAGALVSFDPATFQKWGLGYSGSIYRGQGNTRLKVYALYDHPLAWNARTAYVAMTRHRAEVQLYASHDLAADEATLARLMARIDEDAASISYELHSPEKSPLQERKAALAELRKRMGLSEQPRMDRPPLPQKSRGRLDRDPGPTPEHSNHPRRTPR